MERIIAKFDKFLDQNTLDKTNDWPSRSPGHRTIDHLGLLDDQPLVI